MIASNVNLPDKKKLCKHLQKLIIFLRLYYARHAVAGALALLKGSLSGALNSSFYYLSGTTTTNLIDQITKTNLSLCSEKSNPAFNFDYQKQLLTKLYEAGVRYTRR